MDDLKKYYDRVYLGGKNAHFLKYRHGRTLSEEHVYTKDWLVNNYGGPSDTILDFGCGEADFLNTMDRFAERIGIDFSAVALAKARERVPNAVLRLGTEDMLRDYRNTVNVVTSFGTLEHVDDPRATFLSLMVCVRWSEGGGLIISCPSFLNIRGVIWMTLTLLFEAPMSLSDRHYLTPSSFAAWLQGTNRTMTMHSLDHDVSQGDYFATDMQKRLTNALRDAGMNNSNVDRLIDWVQDNRAWFPQNELSGANMLYVIR